MTTQRLLIIMLVINMVVGLITNAYLEIANERMDWTEEIVEIGEDYQDSLENDDSAPLGATTQIQELTTGNALKMSAKITGIFLRGLSPFPMGLEMARNDGEKVAISLLNVFRTFIILFAGLEIFLLWKNRKAT